MSAHALGIFYGLLACMFWGVTFVIPRILYEASPVLITLCRYLVFGTISLIVLIGRRKKIQVTITRKDLMMSFFLAIMSNSIYYLLAVIGLRLVGVPFGSLVIGLIPITLVIFGREGKLSRKMYQSCSLIFVGLLCLNYQVFGVEAASEDGQLMKLLGVIIVFLCLILWTIYGIKNSRYLKENLQIPGDIWTSLIGLMSLVSFLFMLPILALFVGSPLSEWNGLAANVQLKIVFWSIVSGFFASWLGYNLWNKASQVLPTSLLGQIVVIETISAITADHLIDHHLPSSLTILAVLFILSGTYWGIKNVDVKI